LRLVIHNRVIMIILKDFGFFLEEFFEDYNFCMVKYLSFRNSSSPLRYY